MRSVPSLRNVALIVACASLALACSRAYPLGDVSQKDLATGAGASSGSVADGRVSPVLAAPDVSFALNDTLLDTTANAIANVGDLDGDGYPELVTLNYDNGVIYAHLRYGGPRLEDSVAASGFGESGAFLAFDDTFASFESTVRGAGDVDGDGYGDLLFATGTCDTTQPGEGVYLVYGGPERLVGTQRLMDVSSFFVAPQHQRSRGDRGMGCTGGLGEIAAPGDIDGDGFADLLMGELYSELPVQYNELPVPPDAETGGQFLFYGRAQRFPSSSPWASADAHLHSAAGAVVVPVGDANGDGLADLLLGNEQGGVPGGPTLWVPGSKKRLSGEVDLGSATVLAGGFPYVLGTVARAFGDLDGDGVSDVILVGDDAQLYLFYGAAGLFDDGLDLATAAAKFPVDRRSGLVLIPAGDRDGDGDAELIDQFWDRTGPEDNQSDVALLSGQRQRLSGDVTFPIAEVRSQPGHPRFDPGEQRALTDVIPVGDLDGDGADDLLTVSEEFIPVVVGYSAVSPLLHIHYGTHVPRGPIVR